MKEKLLKSFPVIIELPVAWGDMDALGHVNNVTYFRYFENARVAYFERIKMMEFMTESGVGPILASIQCRFLAPLIYPDMVSIGSWVSEVGEDRFKMKLRIISRRLSRIAADGEALMVTYDYRNNRKVPIPAEMKRSILDFEAGCKAEFEMNRR